MNVVDTKSVGSYANYQIGYDLIGTNNEQGYHTIRCYGVFNVTGNNWSAYNIKASVAGQENSLGYQSYGRGSYTLVSKDVNVYATNEGKCSYSFGGQLTSGYQSSSWASGTAYLPDSMLPGGRKTPVGHRCRMHGRRPPHSVLPDRGHPLSHPA